MKLTYAQKSKYQYIKMTYAQKSKYQCMNLMCAHNLKFQCMNLTYAHNLKYQCMNLTCAHNLKYQCMNLMCAHNLKYQCMNLTYAQKSSTVSNEVMQRRLSAQSRDLSFLKNQRDHLFCSGCFINSSGESQWSPSAPFCSSPSFDACKSCKHIYK